jgi:hypothetical protein
MKFRRGSKRLQKPLKAIFKDGFIADLAKAAVPYRLVAANPRENVPPMGADCSCSPKTFLPIIPRHKIGAIGGQNGFC